MEPKIPSLSTLVRTLQQLPGIPQRHVYKLAHYFLCMQPADLEQFCMTIQRTCGNVELCEKCFGWKEKSLGCAFCSDQSRDGGVVCVVETWHDLCSIERTGSYRGVYHVLGGVISPLEGISPEDLTIMPLIERMRVFDGELILAMNQTPEGEATAAFIVHSLSGCNAKITCLARGLPVGASLEFMDKLTVHKALSERRLF